MRGKPWTNKEVRFVLQQKALGWSYEAIGDCIDRTKNMVASCVHNERRRLMLDWNLVKAAVRATGVAGYSE